MVVIMKKQKKVEKKYFLGYKLQRKSLIKIQPNQPNQPNQGCSTSPFGQRTFATRPPSKAEDMGLSQGSFVSFLEERVKEVFTSIHVSVESTKPAEVYTTRR